MSKSAMQKALDALEREQVMAQDNNGDYTINVTPKHITEAIVELRAALAAQEPPAATNRKAEWFRLINGTQEPAKAVEPEPVAWMYRNDLENMLEMETFCTVYSVQVGSPHHGLSDVPLYTHPAPAKPLSGLLKRATVLHQKGGMPWSEAEKLALSEFGIDDTQIDEIAGNCANSNLASLLDKDDLREYIRTVIVYSSDLSKAQPAKPLSKKQINELAGFGVDYFDRMDFARAVIAEFCKVNGIKEAS